MEFKHIPIMLEPCMTLLQPQRGGVFVDGTLGGGGHSQAILQLLPEGSKLIGIDRDAQAIAAAKDRLAGYKDKLITVNRNFFDISEILDHLGIEKIEGMLLDLGVSSYQFDNPERGFSYNNEDALLDMRMDTSAKKSAYEVINHYTQEDLRRIIRNNSDEKWAARIAEFIVKQRANAPIKTTLELVDIIKAAIPAAARREGGHPAKRTFQAIRIEVNGELDELGSTIENIISRLASGGRLAIITFHSLEDRIVKHLFQKMADPCDCPPRAPFCICGKKPVIKILTRKPIIASERELESNKRAKSAKLRGCEKITD